MTAINILANRCDILATPTGVPTSPAFAALMSLIRKNNRQAAADELRGLAGSQNRYLAPRNVEAMINGLETDNWAPWAEIYRDGGFFGPDGDFLLVAPFQTNRSGVKLEQLSAIQGSLIPHNELPLEAARQAIFKLFGDLRQPLTRVWPVVVNSSAGLLEQECGEGFIVPDGWTAIKDGNGPALNNLTEQRCRFQTAAHCIEKIFDDSSAELLLTPLTTEDDYATIIADEYQMHDFGHATGIGLMSKLASNVLQTTYLGGYEEWRADWVAFALADIMLPPWRMERMLASNLVTRFGLDAHRRGGLLDTDVTAAQLTFSFLIEAEALDVTPTGKLKFTSPTLESLVRDGGIDVLRAEAVRITRAELHANDPRSIWHLFPVTPRRSVELLFREHICDPCVGAFASLR